MDLKDTIKPYVETQLKANTPPTTIKSLLLGSGWSEAIVDEVIAESVQRLQPAQPLRPSIESIRSEVLQEDYGVIQAGKDAFSAIENNLQAVGVAALLGLAATVLGSVLTTTFGIASTAASTATFRSGSTQAFAPIAATFLFAIIVGILSTALTQSLVGLTISDGAEGKKSSIRMTLLSGLRQTGRTALGNVIFCALLFIPVIVAFIPGFIVSITSPSLSWLGIIFIVMGIIAMIPILVRFMLLPFVALFEHDVPLGKLMGRTRFLMNGSFAFTAKLLATAVCFALAIALIGPSQKELQSMSFIAALPFTLLSGILTLLAYSVLVLFYRNRKAVKG